MGQVIDDNQTKLTVHQWGLLGMRTGKIDLKSTTTSEDNLVAFKL